MRVTFHAHGYFRFTSTIGEDGMILTLPDSSAHRIRDLLPTFNVLEEEIERVTLNGEKTRVDHRVSNADRVDFYPKGYGKKVMGRSSLEPLKLRKEGTPPRP